MISLRVELSNCRRYVAACDGWGVCHLNNWPERERVQIASTRKEIPDLIEDAMAIVRALPGKFHELAVHAELITQDGYTLGDYWPRPLVFAIVEKVIDDGTKTYKLKEIRK